MTNFTFEEDIYPSQLEPTETDSGLSCLDIELAIVHVGRKFTAAVFDGFGQLLPFR